MLTRLWNWIKRALGFSRSNLVEVPVADVKPPAHNLLPKPPERAVTNDRQPVDTSAPPKRENAPQADLKAPAPIAAHPLNIPVTPAMYSFVMEVYRGLDNHVYLEMTQQYSDTIRLANVGRMSPDERLALYDGTKKTILGARINHFDEMLTAFSLQDLSQLRMTRPEITGYTTLARLYMGEHGSITFDEARFLFALAFKVASE